MRGYRRNADEGLRRLERRAAAGDPEAQRAVVREQLRTGTLQWLAEAGPPAVRLLPDELRRGLVRALVLGAPDSHPIPPAPPLPTMAEIESDLEPLELLERITPAGVVRDIASAIRGLQDALAALTRPGATIDAASEVSDVAHELWDLYALWDEGFIEGEWPSPLPPGFMSARLGVIPEEP